MQFLKEGILTVGAAVLLWVVSRSVWIAGQGKNNSRYTTSGRELVLLLVVCYVAAVAAITIVPVPMTRADNGALATNNFHLFGTITAVFDSVRSNPGDLVRHDTANFGGNILMFIPAGFLLPFFFAGLRSLPRTAVAALLISALIELTQMVSRTFGVSRSVDVDDVFLNTLGACIGFLIYRIVSRHYSRTAEARST